MKLVEADRESLRCAEDMQFCGGSMPFFWGEYLRREKLRRRGLLRFWKRRSRNWRLNSYELTERGHALLRSYENVASERK